MMKLAKAVLFDVTWLRFIYFIVTILMCAQAAFRVSVVVGGSALIAFALCFFGVATFIGSFHARRDHKYSRKDLAIIGAIALGLCAAGIALVVWSGFRIGLFGASLSGVAWAAVGIAVALTTTTRKDAL
jgi:integral membrane sensor domain MASE1